MKYNPLENSISIVGATSGLGEATARWLAKQGWPLRLIGRNSEKLSSLVNELEALPRSKILEAISVDLLTEGGLQKAQESCVSSDITLNFIGIGLAGDSVQFDEARVRELLRINVEQTTLLTLNISRAYMKRGHGKVINTASLAAFHPIPYFSIYAASKAYLLSFDLALYKELASKRVYVITLCPGGLKTEFHSKAGLKDSIVKDYETFVTEPIVWAKKIENIVKRGKSPQYLLGRESMYSVFTKVLPSTFMASTSGKLYKKYVDI
ncbi:MAG: SDR family NAD(P)-dependent oxidoreductase [Bdellovibrionales bacterium]|nr:SDR family NAD(P)-dependent oxidoreductase [Bdellovibrionales bacterium]